MKKLRFKSSLVLLFFVFFGCFQTAGAAAEKTLKVGITAPLTGHSALWGTNAKAAVKTAFNGIDNKIGDYRIEVVWIDSQSDPAKATNAFSEAVEKKGIDVAFYDVHSSVSVALMDVVSKYEIPLIFPLGAAGTINEKWLSDPDKFRFFGGKGWPEPGKLANGYVEALEHSIANGSWTPPTKKVAIYGEQTDWGKSFCSQLKKSFENAGWEIFSEDYLPNTQTDHYPLLSKYKKGEVSVIAGTITGTSSMTGFIKQSAEIGLKAVIIADGLGWSGNWYSMTGQSSNYVLDMIPQLTTPEAKKWAEDIKKEYGFLPSPNAGGLVYDYANFFIKVANRVLEKHGNLDRASFQDVLVTEVNTGKITYSKKDGAIIMQEYKYTPESMPDPVVAQDYFYFPVIQYFKGKGQIVFPDQWKEQDMKFRK
ncbi:ABC transporter substrate-binding protein [Desulforhopalus singaporensis]|uniref:Branched-chain amino acid transport system substrate-binding protein n=1 Tax=Desulforhopalus singaporensis TaxID=91360 RepID=A0A1H0N8E6_9BACT|nr:ABC transporter substrate-binding protein [Desulforhopalus singaporensis]SDO88999.1 branched-chain amino acid transport system substrate-binding protein [Desulforhopalus singaporensis]